MQRVATAFLNEATLSRVEEMRENGFVSRIETGYLLSRQCVAVHPEQPTNPDHIAAIPTCQDQSAKCYLKRYVDEVVIIVAIAENSAGAVSQRRLGQSPSARSSR
jgi:hypothetical protein